MKNFWKAFIIIFCLFHYSIYSIGQERRGSNSERIAKQTRTERKEISPQTQSDVIVSSFCDPLLSRHEKVNREFLRIETSNRIVYFHQRRIGEAIVDKDFITYQFNRQSGELMTKTERWRDDLPEYVFPAISQQQVEAMVEGEVLFSMLYIISPDSEMFLLTPTPENPCWVVRSVQNGNLIVTIIDAMDGSRLGFAVPPPDSAFALSGPINENPPSDSWYSYLVRSAEQWFKKLGYSVNTIIWPKKSDIEKYVRDPQTPVFYEVAHGDSYRFAGGCQDGRYEWTDAWDIKSWLSSSPKKKLTILWSCQAMAYTGPNSLSYEFRKGEETDTAVVGGYYLDSQGCSTCWYSYFPSWQNRFFQYLSNGKTPYEAFLLASSDYPACYPCIKYAGDTAVTEKYWYPPLNFSGYKVENRSLFQKEYINVLNWSLNPQNILPIDVYRIYELEGDNWNLLTQLSPATYTYWHRAVQKDKKYSYVIVSVLDNVESDPTYTEIH